VTASKFKGRMISRNHEQKERVDMSDNDYDFSPLAAAKRLTPFWMQNIYEFDGLEIMPCKTIGFADSGKEIIEPCETAQVEFWTVYGHY